MLISAAGICSRRQAEQLLVQGRVTVDGTVAGLGDQADPEHQMIRVNGRLLQIHQRRRVLLINKPIGVISSCHDPNGRPTVLDLLPHRDRRGLHPVGRLDADSRGALLLTDAAARTLQLTHPRYDHAKTYEVRVQGVPDADVLQRWRAGIPLEGRLTRRAEVRLLRPTGRNSVLEVVLREGRNRQIRRVAEVLGHPVLDLKRTAIAGVHLGDLAEGCWRELSEREWKPLLDGGTTRSGSPGLCD